MFRELRRLFLSGLLVIVPLVTTFWVVVGVFNLFDSWFANWFLHLKIMQNVYEFLSIPKEVRPYGAGFIMTIGSIMGIGILTRYWFGAKLLILIDNFILYLPFIGGMYKALKQVSSALFGSNRRVFDKVVFLEYPRQGIYSLGFVTREDVKVPAIKPEQRHEVMCLFVPTTPNPTSGVFIMAPRHEVVETSITSEEAMKMVISAGMVMPGDEEIEEALAGGAELKQLPETQIEPQTKQPSATQSIQDQ